MVSRNPDFITPADVAPSDPSARVVDDEQEFAEWESMMAEAGLKIVKTQGKGVWGRQHHPSMKKSEAEKAASAIKTSVIESMKDFFKPDSTLDLLTEEVQKACDTVAEVTAAKKELTKEIDRLEKKLTQAYLTMKGVTAELTDAVEKMAIETERLRGAVAADRHEN